MKQQKKKPNIALPVALVVCLGVFLIIGSVMFSRYLDSQIFIERTTQLVELTAQVRANLGNVLDSHWNYLAAAVNDLQRQRFDRTGDVVEVIIKLESILSTDSYGSMLILLDSQGNCYDASGKRGIWSEDTERLAGEEERYAFISESPLYDGSYWTFVRKFDAPLRTRLDGVTFTHAALLKDVRTMAQYYDSAAYGSQNETYVLKSDGTRIHDNFSDSRMIQNYNVLKVLEQMDGQSYPDIRAALTENNTISTNFKHEGTEYYYCITSLEEYDTLVMFLIPAKFVASGTVDMVNTVVGTLLLLALVVVALFALAVAAVLRQHSSNQLYLQEQSNLRQQEELNRQLEESNAMLAQSKESAEQAFKIAEEANKAKSSFLSNMSHDIRTPMNAIVGFSALLSRDAENPDKVREYTKKITSSSQHLLGLINDILDISKIEAGKTTLNLSEESMVDLIEGIDSIIRPQMKAKGHTFEVYSKNLKHEHVVMDKLRLNQILLNLLSNAVKYTPDGGLVTLTLQELPQHTKQLACYRFTVADNGYGMSEEYQKKLFQAFTREEDSVTNRIQGTGLGMAITKNLLDLMGGTISVKSEKGKGSTFTVDLELQINNQSVDLNFWKNNGITSILVIDDEEVVCQNVQMAMKDTGVTVEYALDGRAAVAMEAKARAEEKAYDIILLDWKMPGMDGVETAKAIRQQSSDNIPIIILTSYDWPEIEEAASAAGVNAFMPKPFFLTSFRQKVDGVLSGGQTASEPETDGDESSVLQGMHILVAEDNEINAEILNELLVMCGATCEICENGQLAVDAFAGSAPGEYQLILMDVQMPVMNGYDATKAIRELDHPLATAIPIVAMTANAFAEDVRDALNAGMNAHVAKPVDMAVLEQTIRQLLEAE